MLKKVDKVFIGKYIERTATLIAGAKMIVLQADAVAGEIVVLDEQYNVLVGAGATYANSKKIYLAEGSEEIFNTSNPDGTALSGRRILIGSAIEGSKVVNYDGDAYEAKSEALSTLSAIADTVVAGTEYVLRIVFKGDIAAQHPGQNTETHRYVAKTGDASSDVYDGLVSRINKRYTTNTPQRGRNKVIVATNNAGALEIRTLPVVSCTTSVDDIDEFVMNDFEAFLNYVDNDYNWQEVALTSDKTYAGSDRGFGAWESVRDVEKHAQSYEGVTNRVWFPIIKPAMRTVKGAEYDMINIEHDTVYRSSDNQYNKETSKIEVIALEKSTGATAPQNAEILATLNTWMASTPNAFGAVSFA